MAANRRADLEEDKNSCRTVDRIGKAEQYRTNEWDQISDDV
jgi:hypothetical protein